MKIVISNKYLYILTTTLIGLFLVAAPVLAAPTILSEDIQNFQKNQSSAELNTFTITDDLASPVIKQGELKISIPDELAMIFNDEYSLEQIAIFGSAVDNGKVAQKPVIRFTNKDKTLVIPVLADFAASEQLGISKAFVEGFHSSPTTAQYLYFQVNDDSTKYQNTRYMNILSSSLQDTHDPEKVTNLVIQDRAEGGVLLTWTDPTDLDITVIELLRGKNTTHVDAGNPYGYATKGEQQFIDSGLQTGDQVTYILRATDGRNYSDLTEELTFIVGSGSTAPAGDTTGDDTTADDDTTSDDTTSDDSSDDTASDDATDDGDDTTDTDDGDDPDSEDSDDDSSAQALTYAEEQEAVKSTDATAQGAIVTKDFTKAADKCEAAIMLTRVAGISYMTNDEGEEVSKYFTDVPDWCAGAADTLKELGIVQGRSEGIFGAEGNVSRYEIAVMIDRALKLSQSEVPEDIPDFTDINSVPDWALGAVKRLASRDILKGFPDTPESGQISIGGEQAIIKIDLAIMLYRAQNLFTGLYE